MIMKSQNSQKVSQTKVTHRLALLKDKHHHPMLLLGYDRSFLIYSPTLLANFAFMTLVDSEISCNKLYVSYKLYIILRLLWLMARGSWFDT